MSNPFEKNAAALVARAGQIADDGRRAKEAAEAERLERERSFERAVALFAAVEGKVDECLRLANEAFRGSGLALTKKVSPIAASNAGSIAVSLSGSGMQPASFRIVGNASYRLFVHELEDPKYGPFDLADPDAVPYEDMFNHFIKAATEKLSG